MQITNNKNQINFAGIHILNTRCLSRDNKITRLKVFELTREDMPFLQQMYRNIELEKYVTNIPPAKMEVWYTMLKETINLSGANANKSYLLAKGKRPCGIITFEPNSNKYEITRVCTWPVKKREKVPLAGKTLFKIAFEDFLKSSANIITIDAIKNGPYDTVSKYMQLGFKPMGGGNFIEVMRTTRTAVIQTLQKLNSLITSKPTGKTENVNLFEKLSI